MRSGCRAPQPVERRRASPSTCSSLSDNLIPGKADRPLGLELVEALVELGSLGIAQGESFRVSPEGFPQLIEKFELLLTTETSEIQRRVAHGRNVAQKRPEGYRVDAPGAAPRSGQATAVQADPRPRGTDAAISAPTRSSVAWLTEAFC